LARIQRRLELLNAAAESGREHWLHMHERADVLSALSRSMRTALSLVRQRTGAGVVLVDNSSMRQDGVVELMAERIQARARGRGALLGLAPADRAAGSALLVPPPAALLPAGGGRLVLLAAGPRLSYRVAHLTSGQLSGPHVLDPEPCLGVVPMPRPGGDAWVLYTAQSPEGVMVRLARMDGSGQAGRWNPAADRPGLLSRVEMLQGGAAAGAWLADPGGEDRALMVYAEPSRTELWGALLDPQGKVVRRPWRLAATEDEWLLCDRDGRGWTAVSATRDGRPAGWRVSCATYHVDPAVNPRERRLELFVGSDVEAASRRSQRGLGAGEER
jgi:hypothetical protein